MRHVFFALGVCQDHERHSYRGNGVRKFLLLAALSYAVSGYPWNREVGTSLSRGKGMIRRLLMMALVLSALVMSGCASVPMASKSADAQAKLFTPTTGKATVYIYRNEIIGAAIKMPLLIDGIAIGDTAAKTYVEQVLPPGTHVITSKAENDATLSVSAQAGQTYYVWQEVKMGVLYARSKLHLVDEATGRNAVEECSLIQATNPLTVPAQTEQAATPVAAPSSEAVAPMAVPSSDVSAASVAPVVSTPVATTATTPASDLASLDARINRPMFTAAQNVAATQQCDSMIHVLSVSGESAMFSSECAAGRDPLRIACDGASCAPLPAR